MGRVVFVCLATALLLPLALACPETGDIGPVQMALLPNNQLMTAEDVPEELVNGGFAAEESLGSLTKGPKVNGGFAINPPLKKTDEKHRVSNADCAGGHIVDGKCLRPFPKPARKATVADNMESPEQTTHAVFEADIHQFVKKHFGQEVMEETPTNTHNVGLPGAEIIDMEMNKHSNANADDAAASLFPVGTDMMRNGDSEVDVSLIHEMNGPASQHKLSEMTHHDDSAEPVTHATHQAPAPIVNEVHEEVGEIINPPQNIIDEDADLESVAIPKDQVTDEPSLPPTPTPTPTPDLELIAKQREEEDRHAQEVAACLAVMEREHIQCSNTPAENAAMTASAKLDCTAMVQTVANTTCPGPQVQLANSTFDATNVRGNLQSLVLYCTSVATKLMVDNTESATTQMRAHFAQKLVKYSTLLTCLDSDDFPGCAPEEAIRVVQREPSDGEWTCI